jgi:Ca2+-dependent lipid-binding protein
MRSAVVVLQVTRTKYETQNMLFNETFVFENVMLTPDEWACEKLGLSLWDRNDFLTNKKIGGIEFSLDNIYRQKQHEYFRKWVPITLPEAPGKEHGFLHISVHVLKRGINQPFYPSLPLI